MFHELDSREGVGRFDGGEITSDAGGLLLREVEKRTRILGRMSECFDDHQAPERIEHSVVGPPMAGFAVWEPSARGVTVLPRAGGARKLRARGRPGDSRPGHRIEPGHPDTGHLNEGADTDDA